MQPKTVGGNGSTGDVQSAVRIGDHFLYRFDQYLRPTQLVVQYH